MIEPTTSGMSCQMAFQTDFFFTLSLSLACFGLIGLVQAIGLSPSKAMRCADQIEGWSALVWLGVYL